jgi:hypothetical protein
MFVKRGDPKPPRGRLQDSAQQSSVAARNPAEPMPETSAIEPILSALLSIAEVVGYGAGYPLLNIPPDIGSD